MALPFLLLHTHLLLLSITYGMEHLFGQLGSAVPSVSPCSFLFIPNLLTGMRNSKSLDHMEALYCKS